MSNNPDVQQQITAFTTKLMSARENLMELQLTDMGGNDLYKKNIQLIESSKSQLHQIIDQYFKDLSANYLYLQSKYPSKEIKELIIKQIDLTFKELSEYQTKLQNNIFTLQDYQTFKSSNFLQVKKEVQDETDRLVVQNQKNEFKNHKEENMPYVRIENRIVEGLYLGLNQYASVQWPGETPANIHDKLVINQEQFFVGDAQFLPLIDESQQSITVYDLNTRQIHQSPFEGKSMPVSPTLTQTPTGEMWLSGGICNGFIQGSLFHIDVEKLIVTKKADMLVGRVGHSCCYVPPLRTGGVGDSGFIYVFGGRTDNNVRTRLCERYNLQTGVWEFIEKMPESRSRAAVVYYQESQSIYVFFGTGSDQQNVSSCIRYELLSGRWESVFLQNYLPGFDITYGSGIQINKDQILLFGGMRDSMYFKDNIYFNRKLLLFNTHNDSMTVLEIYLPIDFIPIGLPIVHNGSVLQLGSFMNCNQAPPHQSMWMDGAFILEINSYGAKVNDYLDSTIRKPINNSMAEQQEMKEQKMQQVEQKQEQKQEESTQQQQQHQQNQQQKKEQIKK